MAIASTLHECLKNTDKYGNEKAIRGDAYPFHGEDVNYADAKLYKSLDSETSQMSLDLKGGNRKESPQLLLYLIRSLELSAVMLVKPRNINPYNQRCCSNTCPRRKERLDKRT